jgi:hypothetical protein
MVRRTFSTGSSICHANPKTLQSDNRTGRTLEFLENPSNLLAPWHRCPVRTTIRCLRSTLISRNGSRRRSCVISVAILQEIRIRYLNAISSLGRASQDCIVVKDSMHGIEAVHGDERKQRFAENTVEHVSSHRRHSLSLIRHSSCLSRMRKSLQISIISLFQQHGKTRTSDSNESAIWNQINMRKGRL